LVGLLSCPSCVAGSSILGLLGADGSGTDVENTVHVRESWNAISMLVSIEQIIVTGVAETLMPQESFCGGLDGRYRSISLDVCMERELVELHRQLGHLLSQLGLNSLVVSMDC